MGEKCPDKLLPADNRLWQRRHINHLRQKDISVLLSYKTPSIVSRWEQGKEIPSLVNALRLSQILHSSVESLFPGLTRHLGNEIKRREKRLTVLKVAH
jgi:transcriptional regulator with XRE-family HTH domain